MSVARPRSGKPMAAPADKTQKSSRRRQDILATAVTLFDRHGYQNTSLDDIARAVGIKREALYYYYRNRAEILQAIIRPQSEALVEGLAAIVAGPGSARDKLRAAIDNHLRRFDRYCLEMTVSLRDGLLEDAGDVRGEMRRIWKRYESLWAAIIAEGQRSGEFAAIGEPKLVAFGILGMCNWLARWYDPKKDSGVDQIIDTFFGVAARGLLAR